MDFFFSPSIHIPYILCCCYSFLGSDLRKVGFGFTKVPVVGSEVALGLMAMAELSPFAGMEGPSGG